MATYTFGKLQLDPQRNPAVLDTTTWNREAAVSQVFHEEDSFWDRLEEYAGKNVEPPIQGKYCTVYPASHAPDQGGDVYLTSLPDGQDLFVHIGPAQRSSKLGYPMATKPIPRDRNVSLYPSDMEIVARYLKELNPEKAPRPLGSVPRLGIGGRHSTLIWPAAIRGMAEGRFAANAIQNSVRELNLLQDLKDGKPPLKNYLFSFGMIAEGHTGSTFEGLLHAGILAMVKDPSYPKYGADADHIQVKRGTEGLVRAKQVIEASRYYTFYTMDVSDILDYNAYLEKSDARARQNLELVIPDALDRRDVLLYYKRSRRIGGRGYNFSEGSIGRLVGKYWGALQALEKLCTYVKAIKGEQTYDLELSIDENPPEVSTCSCITQPEEVLFLSLEIERRNLPITHLAPNFGVEKSTDYRCKDGLAGLESRVREIHEIASLYNLMLDCHSGDDLLQATRRVFGSATEGRINFKISPMLQLMFADTLYEFDRDIFIEWWNDVYQFVRGEAEKGSSFARECLQEVEKDPTPHPRKKLFYYYCFVSVGRRDAQNRFVLRDKLYDVSTAFRREYTERLTGWLLEIAEDLYGGR